MAFPTKVFSLALVSVTLVGTSVTAQQVINGSGATFPAPFYQAAFSSLSSTGLKVNYQSVGSGAGVRQFVAGTVDFGATDEPIKSAESTKVARGVVQIPIVGGTIALAYNKAGCSDLRLTQKQLVEVFLGEIKTWEQLKCGKGPITVVHRSDGSGTTFAFTNTLSSFSPEWKKRVGEGKSVNWPVGVGGKGNEGVAGVLSNTPGSLGYVNQAFVKGPLKAAALQNKAGRFVKPGLKGGVAALANISLDTNLAGENPNPAGQDSYPISTLTWILAYKSGNGVKTDEIRKAINYLLGPAQAKADDLGYVPLHGSILTKAKSAVLKIGK